MAAADEARKRWGEGRSPRAEAAHRLREAGITGLLVVSGRDCRLRALRLPSLAPAVIDAARACRFSIGANGRLSLGEAVPQPAGPFTAWCRSGWVEFAARGGSSLPFTRLYRLRGCRPAWKPGGTLTYLRAGELVELRMRCGGGGFCTRVLISAAALRRSVGPAALVEVAWLDDETVAAIAREQRSGDYALAIFERGRLGALARLGGERIAGLQASPRGTYLAVRQGEDGPVVVRDRRLRPVPLPLLGLPRAIAWSPDERWIAAAGQDGLLLSPLEDPGARPIRLPLEAVRVAWRGGATRAYPLQGSS